jgi:hypothetical protein
MYAAWFAHVRRQRQQVRIARCLMRVGQRHAWAECQASVNIAAVQCDARGYIKARLVQDNAR